MALPWINHINKAYINLAAPTIKVFKLDKTATQIDDLYGEEKTSRIYLPPFEMKAFHLTNLWRQMLGGTYPPFREEEENIQFIMNFEDMVQHIREIKDKHVSDIYITYSGSGTPSAYKSGDSFALWDDDSIVGNWDLAGGIANTVSKLAGYVEALSDFSVTLEGDNDSSSDIVNFNKTYFSANERLQVYSKDNTYRHITDVIEMGDCVLTNKWRLYEVLNAAPAGDFGWDWVQWSITANLAKLDRVSLPGDYNSQIAEHQYGIKDRIEME